MQSPTWSTEAVHFRLKGCWVVSFQVADKFIRQNRHELVLKQASDAKLADIRRRVESGSVTKSRGFSTGETKLIRKNGLIYRLLRKM